MYLSTHSARAGPWVSTTKQPNTGAPHPYGPDGVGRIQTKLWEDHYLLGVKIRYRYGGMH